MNDLPDLPQLDRGRYRHYKGNEYEVIDVALHSETLEPMVIYRPLYKTNVKLFARPYAMFVEQVENEGTQIPRYQKISE
jgi:hypothetical protein